MVVEDRNAGGESQGSVVSHRVLGFYGYELLLLLLISLMPSTSLTCQAMCAKKKTSPSSSSCLSLPLPRLGRSPAVQGVPAVLALDAHDVAVQQPAEHEEHDREDRPRQRLNRLRITSRAVSVLPKQGQRAGGSPASGGSHHGASEGSWGGRCSCRSAFVGSACVSPGKED